MSKLVAYFLAISSVYKASLKQILIGFSAHIFPKFLLIN